MDEDEEFRAFLQKMIEGFANMSKRMTEIAELCKASSENLKEFAEVFRQTLKSTEKKEDVANGSR